MRHRATVVYIAMALFAAGGMWGILAIGGSLVAPPDFSGRWAISGTGPAGWGPNIAVEQSGRFFQISIQHGPLLKLAMQGWSASQPTSAPVRLTGGPWQLSLTQQRYGKAMDCVLQGPQAAHWRAQRLTQPTAGGTAAAANVVEPARRPADPAHPAGSDASPSEPADASSPHPSSTP